MFEKNDDHSVLVSGKNGKDTYRFEIDSDMQNITGVRLEAMNDKRLTGGGPGRSTGGGNFVLNEIKLFAAPKDAPQNKVEIKLQMRQQPSVKKVGRSAVLLTEMLARVGLFRRNSTRLILRPLKLLQT